MTPKERAAVQDWLWSSEKIQQAVKRFQGLSMFADSFAIESCEFQLNDALKLHEAAITALREALAEQAEPEPMYISESCVQRGGACYYSVEVDGEPVTVYAAPVEPVKQEPVAKVIVRQFNPMDASYPTVEVKWLKEPVSGFLYAAPVRTKDLTDDEIESIMVEQGDLRTITFARAVIAADREKNK